jgi:PAS domain S-box-containing protein
VYATEARPAPRAITVVLDDNFPPLIFRDSSGRLQGLVKETWELWEKHTGTRVDLRAMEWAKAQDLMREGGADVIDTIGITGQRTQLYDFSEPYISLDMMLFFHKSLSGIVDVNTSRAFTVGVKAGDKCINALREGGAENLRQYENYETLIDAAASGEVRVFCMNELPATYYLARRNLNREFRHSPPLYSSRLHWAVRKGNSTLQAHIANGFARITPAERQALKEKWLGADLLRKSSETPLIISRYVGYALAALLSTACALLMWNYALRRRVAGKTAELSGSIDELRKAHQAARNARDDLAATMEAIPDLLFELDQSGRYIQVKSMEDSLLAAPKENLTGRHVTEVLPPEAAATILEALQNSAVNGRDYGRVISLRLDMGERWFELSVARKQQNNGEEPHFIVLSRDVTGRVAAEKKALHLSNLYATLSSCNQAIFHCREEAGLWQEICRTIVSFGGLKMAWIGLLGEGDQLLRPIASCGEGTEYLNDIRISADTADASGRGPTGTAIREDRPFWCHDFMNDPATEPWHERGSRYGWAASAALPLHFEGAVIGALTIYADRRDVFDEDAQNLFRKLAQNIDFALDHFRREAERARLSLEIMESEKKYRELAESMADVIWTLDPETLRFLYVSPSASRLHGFTSQEVMARPLEDTLAPESARRASSLLIERLAAFREGKLQSSDSFVDDIELQCPDGSTVWTEVVTSLVTNQSTGRIEVRGVTRDISDRRKAEEGLRKLSQVVEQSPTPIMITDTAGYIEYVNPAFSTVTGYSAEETLGRHAHFLSSGKTPEETISDMWQQLERGEIWKGEFSNRRRDGSDYTEQNIIAPLRDRQGTVTHYLAIKEDITEIRKSQRDLRERIKEQSCLYDIFALTEDIRAPLETQLRLVVNRIPLSWQYPEITAARLDYGNSAISTSTFTDTNWMLTVETPVSQGENIKLTIAYLEERPPEDEGPFFREERLLAEAIVKRLADIIERRNELEVVKEQERLVATMFAQTTDAIILMETQTGRFVDFNAMAHQGLGYTREEFVRLSVAHIQAEHSPERIAENIENAAHGTPTSFETRHRHRDGSLRDVTVTLRAITLGGRPIVCAVWRDITEQKAREGELEIYRLRLEELVATRTAELEAIYQEQRAIFESATVGILLIRNRVIARCNHALEEIFGYLPGELTGQSTRIWYEDEQTFAMVGREEEESIAASGTYHRSELQLRRKDNSLFWARKSAQRVSQADPAAGLVVIIEDMTSEREATETLRSAKERAEAADLLKSAFLATMSHELRTPLNSIIGFTGMLQQKLSGPINDEQARQLAIVRNSANHLLTLINDILDISKIESGQLTLSRERFNLLESILRVVQSVRPLAESKSLELIVEAGRDITTVFADKRRIEQILFNLLSNAVKFTEHGSISVQCERAGDSYVISVRDTGIGITPDGLKKLFQPFQQIDNSLSRKYEGSGLGLSISKQLAELMGGDIGVESDYGRGSLFWFTTPADISDVQPHLLSSMEQVSGETFPAADIHENSSALRGNLAAIRDARILLVEDNESNQELVLSLLKEAGLRVDTADNGRIALDMVQQRDYDLVLMDMQMPVMDGVSATKEIRKLMKYAGLPIIAMTANAMQRDRDICRAADMNDFIAKPFEPEQLWAVLLKWITPRLNPAQPSSEPPGTNSGDTVLPESINGIDMPLGLQRSHGKKPLYLSLLRKFLAGNGETAEKIRQSLDSGDRETATLLAHTLKGVAGAIGASRLQTCAASLEQAFREWHGREEMDALLAAVESALNEVLDCLEATLPPELLSAPVTVDRAVLASVCLELTNLLRDDDAAACDLLETRSALLRTAFPEAFPVIETAIRGYDFETALEMLRSVVKRCEP